MNSIHTKINDILLLCILWVVGTMTMTAQERNDSMSSSSADADNIKVSLVTCSPGQLVYELFGHTAIRVEDPKHRQDLVFNYGVFNFNTDNFVYRFVKGETDYELGVVEWKYFIHEYAIRGSSIDVQEINLTADEKIEVVNYLLNNYEPRNRTYRYNYFYDNCTTRARDVIEESVAGQVFYIPVNNNLTCTPVHIRTSMVRTRHRLLFGSGLRPSDRPAPADVCSLLHREDVYLGHHQGYRGE